MIKGWALFFDHPLPYALCADLQAHLVQARINGCIPDCVLFVEHLPVITLGRRGRNTHLLASPAHLSAHGISLETATRGGDVTYHGPGQLVMYPILHLGDAEADTHGYMYNLEKTAMHTARAFQVRAFRRKGMNGAWTKQGKLAAIGFRLERWVTSHGMSFNVNNSLDGFKYIVPCGLKGEKVTSLQNLLPSSCPELVTVRSEMCRQFQRLSGRSLHIFQQDRDLLPEELNSLLQSTWQVRKNM
jgi:lipoate-protein ligase B